MKMNNQNNYAISVILSLITLIIDNSNHSYYEIMIFFHITNVTTLVTLQPETSLDFSHLFFFLNLPQNIHFLVFLIFMDVFWKKTENSLKKYPLFKKVVRLKQVDWMG